MSTSSYLDLVKIPNSSTSIITTLTGDSEELERYSMQDNNYTLITP